MVTVGVAEEVANLLMTRYAGAVNANDSAAYGRLFTQDAIRVPPGTEPEHGPEAIAAGEQKDYDVWSFDIEMTALDTLQLSADYVYCLVRVDADLTAHDGSEKKSIIAHKNFLMERQPDGDWLIKRYGWNLL